MTGFDTATYGRSDTATPSAASGAAGTDRAGGDPALRLEEVTKRFGATVAVNAVSVDVAAGELLAVVGPSGCGKSTLLRLIAGLTGPDSGRVSIGGREMAGPWAWVPPERRGVGVVFQDHALFPHLTVAGNVAFGLGRRHSRRGARVEEALDLVGLSHLGARYPHELSGGEAQRVALARALAPGPTVVLLDEPFSNLDRNLRVRIREDTVAVLRAAGATGVFVTHDQEEALAVGDRVAVISDGRMMDIAAPDVVFHCPASRFVATFLGEADFLPGRQAGATAMTSLGPLPVAGEPDVPRDVDVMVRPHEVGLTADPSGTAVVRRAEFRGAFTAYTVDLDSGGTLRSLRPHTERLPAGTRVGVHVDAGHRLAVFPTAASVAVPADE